MCECDKCNDIIPITPACPCPDATPETAITSTGNTIEVTHVGIVNGKDTWNVEKECCIDNKVSVDWTDTPAFLEVQLINSPDSAITRQKVNWPDGTKVMQPVLDQTKISKPDQKVAAANWCASWFLTETLTTNDNTYFSWDTASCKTRLNVKKRQLLRFDCYVDKEEHIDLQADDVWFVAVPSTAMWYNITSSHTANVGTQTVWTWYTFYVLTIPRTARYNIQMQWSVTSVIAHTLRHQICTIDGNILNDIPLLDSRTEWTRRQDQNSNDLIDAQNELNKSVELKTNTELADADWEEMWIAYTQRWQWFAWVRPLLLNAWTKLIFVTKYNTKNKNTFRVNWSPSVTYTSNWADLSTNGKWAGTSWSVIELPEYSLTD